ncbi:SMP-30/gluconolactonase/LRE family protein [Micromonospora sp. CPCC 205371]|nr:SMP-30/gluconolactonase/LRE family protein [Micromonospora sp. CPCC 205371]
MPAPRILPGDGGGPEDVAVPPLGTVYTGVEEGRILAVPPSGAARVVAETGGRPLGIEIAADGTLLVCDAYRGLLHVEPASGRFRVLVPAGDQLTVCNNAAIAGDGTVYFSDSTRRFPLAHWRGDLLEHSGTGRLLRRTPDGAVDVLLDGLQFANGVALAADESFVVVAETGAYRLTRLWLTGSRAGQRDTLVDNLPGFPDNLSTGSDGRIWIAIGSPRNRLLDWAHARTPLIRRTVWALPEHLQPGPERTAWAMAVDGSGRVVADLQGAGDRYHFVTGVREHAGRLYLGSLVESAIAVVDLM